jgi:HAD superfamily hydrolase (TIGR01509 family)
MAERSTLDAVVFDAGGTLVRLDFEWISGMLAELGAHATPEQLRRGEVLGRRRYDAAATAPRAMAPGVPHPPLGSVAPIEAYWSGMLEAAGCRHPVLEEAIERMHARQHSDDFLWARPMEGARATLDALPALGLRACCVSNSDGRAEAHLVRYGVREGLEFVVDSQVVGIEKPDPRIFGIALDRMGVPPDRALYVGDIRSVDEHGARAAGMHFVLIDPFGGYAPAGTASVAAMEELPAFIEATFATPSSVERRRP